MKIRRIDIGAVIRQKIGEKGLSKAAFAKAIGLQRQNIEKTVLDKQSIDTNLLCIISEVLGCNLFDYYKSDADDSVQEIKAVITIEMGAEKQNKTLKFSFGKNVTVAKNVESVSIN